MAVRSPMSADEADAIAKRTVEHLRPVITKAIEDAEDNLLTRMGVDPGKLGEVQKDFAFMRSQRELKEAVIKQGILAVLGLCIVGIVTALGFWVRGGMPK